ncbi:MAG: C4-dicarboxylate ABC transporter substrate-binding protein, partial [Alphaproteobacteria bacterium]
MLRRPLLTALAVVFAAPALAQDLPRVEWNLSTWGNPRPFTLGAVTVAERVAAAIEGRFTLRVHYGEALSALRENLD